MTTYVAGLLFRQNRQHVALIRKDHPAWQAGKLNAIGGKVNGGENCSAAMAREFREETGFQTVDGDWRMFCKLYGEDWEVYFFVADAEHPAILQTIESEVPDWFGVDTIPTREDIIPNLRWLIPMAIDKDNVSGQVADYSNF